MHWRKSFTIILLWINKTTTYHSRKEIILQEITTTKVTSIFNCCFSRKSAVNDLLCKDSVSDKQKTKVMSQFKHCSILTIDIGIVEIVMFSCEDNAHTVIMASKNYPSLRSEDISWDKYHVTYNNITILKRKMDF